MATYFLRVKVISRGKGGRIMRSAAYRAGERLRDERTGAVYDHTGRNDVPFKEVVLPSQFAGRGDVDWARDRATLWNAAEHAGKARNSRLGREVLVILPSELAAEQRIALARQFAQELANRYRGAVDLCIHRPRPGADERHHHAHLLMTTREVTPEGLGSRTALELSGQECHARGLRPTREEFLYIRERWAQVANAALHAAGIEARIDHRSYDDQGINQEPKPHIPRNVYYAEKRTGESTPAGEDIRARYRERLEARRLGAAALERVMERQREEGRRKALENAARKAQSAQKSRWSVRTRDAHPVTSPEERAARRWLEHFAKQDTAAGQPTPEQVAQKWLKYFEAQDAAEAARLDGAKRSEQPEASASADHVEHHRHGGLRREGAGAHHDTDDRTEARSESERDRSDVWDRTDDHGPGDLG